MNVTPGRTPNCSSDPAEWDAGSSLLRSLKTLGSCIYNTRTPSTPASTQGISLTCSPLKVVGLSVPTLSPCFPPCTFSGQKIPMFLNLSIDSTTRRRRPLAPLCKSPMNGLRLWPPPPSSQTIRYPTTAHLRKVSSLFIDLDGLETQVSPIHSAMERRILPNQWPAKLDLAFPSHLTQLYAAGTPLTSSTTVPSLSSMQPLAQPSNISNFATIQLIERSGSIHTPMNSVASAKALVPTPPTQVNVSKAPTPSRSSDARTFRTTAAK